MEDPLESLDALIRSGARRLAGFQRRSFQAEVAAELCGGNARQAERRFGWGRATVAKGMQERHHGLRCLEDFAARGRRRSEEKDPRLAADIRAIVEPHTHAEPELKSSRRYTNLSAAEVRAALIEKGYPQGELPSERTMRDILNRMNYRLKRLRKGVPLKKTEQTDADLRQRPGGAGGGPRRPRDAGDLDGHQGEGGPGRVCARGGKPGPAPTVRWPRAGITTRPPRRSWPPSAS